MPDRDRSLAAAPRPGGIARENKPGPPRPARGPVFETGKVSCMNCQEFWNGEPHALEHLEACPNCAARWQRQERLSLGLHALGAQMRGVEAPPRVERRLVSAYRAHSELGGIPPRAAWFAVGAWAAAVAATAVAGGGFLRRPPAPPEP